MSLLGLMVLASAARAEVILHVDPYADHDPPAE